MSKWVVDIHGEIEGDYELICKAESIIPLDKIKQAREKIQNMDWKFCTSKRIDGNRVRTELIDRKDVLDILDELIEGEEKE